MITAPYNFVPLSDKVVMPFWAKHVSHDIPFENAQSGTLKVKITAKSPIYVRNGVSRAADLKATERNEFNNIDGRYFIPGSSLKGMIRNIMEIMSYGRMKNKVNDHKYSVRDFNNDNIYDKSDISKNAECGWLYKEGDTFYIDECGKPKRISHKTLDDKFSLGISSFFQKKDFFREKVKNEQGRFIEAKSAYFKYLKFKGIEYNDLFSSYLTKTNTELCDFSADGKKGTIVLTGQPGVRYFNKNRNKWEGKHLEFVFFEPKNMKTEVSEKVIENFFFAYYDHDRNQQKDDWKWRKKQLDRGEKIPVFFRKDSKGKIIDMGLTQLYKITYKNSIVDLINNQQAESNEYDLAETIFGFTEDKKALKGRVHFGHAFMDNQKEPMGIKTEVLSGPKASYYPNYVEQRANNEGELAGNYSTYMNNTAKIRGWKRYPVRTGDSTISNPGTENVATKFNPLPANTEFSFDITYHNLRKEELGALLSALTFHNTDGLFHSIGSAKPLGYGKVCMEIENLENSTKNEMLKAYELFMDFRLGNDEPTWHKSEQIKELLAMSKPGNDATLSYMSMKKRKSDDEPMDFITAKQNKLVLSKYSIISKNKVDVKSLITPEELNNIKYHYEVEKTLFENQEDISSVEGRLLGQKRKELNSALDQKKDDLLMKLKERRQALIEISEEQKAQQEEKERLEKRAGKQKDAIAEGLSFETIDFEINVRKLEDQVAKIIIDYAKTIHNCNEKELDEIPVYLSSQSDVELTIDAIKKIYDKLSGKEKNEKKMKYRLERWVKWIGKAEVLSLYKELTK